MAFKAFDPPDWNSNSQAWNTNINFIGSLNPAGTGLAYAASISALSTSVFRLGFFFRGTALGIVAAPTADPNSASTTDMPLGVIIDGQCKRFRNQRRRFVNGIRVDGFDPSWCQMVAEGLTDEEHYCDLIAVAHPTTTYTYTVYGILQEERYTPKQQTKGTAYDLGLVPLVATAIIPGGSAIGRRTYAVSGIVYTNDHASTSYVVTVMDGAARIFHETIPPASTRVLQFIVPYTSQFSSSSLTHLVSTGGNTSVRAAMILQAS